MPLLLPSDMIRPPRQLRLVYQLVLMKEVLVMVQLPLLPISIDRSLT